jgi:hypothetical protein
MSDFCFASGKKSQVYCGGTGTPLQEGGFVKKLLLSMAVMASVASAKDTIGKFGIGGNTTLGEISGLNVVYQTSKLLVLDATLGLNYVSPGSSDASSVFGWGVAAHAFLNFADYQAANLLLGVGANVGGDDLDNTEGVDFSIEAPLRLMWHASDHIAFFTQTGLFFDITQDRLEDAENDFRFGIRTDLLGSAGATFYF